MIDKSIRQHYEVTAPRKKKVKGQLHKLAYITDKEAKLLQKFGGQKVMTPEKIPAYPPPGERGGPGSGSEGRSPGGGGGGGGGEAAMAANIAAAAASSRAAAAEAAAKSKRDMQATIAKAEKAEAARVATPISGGESMARFGTPVYAGMTTKVADDIISRGEGKVDVGFQEALKKQNIISRGEGKVDVGFQEILTKKQIEEDLRKKQKDPNFGQFFRPQPVVEKKSSGLGSFLKNAAMALIPGLLPAKLAQGYRLAKLGYDLKNRKGVYGTALRLGENLTGKDVGDFIRTGGSKFDRLNPNEMKNVRTVKPTRESGDGNEANRKKTLAETVTQGTGLEEGQKLLGLDDKQIQQIYQGRDLLKQTIESGMYQDRRLNMNEMKMLQGHIIKMENLIQAIEKAQAPVPVAHGGLIDKPFTGRSRDI